MNHQECVEQYLTFALVLSPSSGHKYTISLSLSLSHFSLSLLLQLLNSICGHIYVKKINLAFESFQEPKINLIMCLKAGRTDDKMSISKRDNKSNSSRLRFQTKKDGSGKFEALPDQQRTAEL